MIQLVLVQSNFLSTNFKRSRTENWIIQHYSSCFLVEIEHCCWVRNVKPFVLKQLAQRTDVLSYFTCSAQRRGILGLLWLSGCSVSPKPRRSWVWFLAFLILVSLDSWSFLAEYLSLMISGNSHLELGLGHLGWKATLRSEFSFTIW